MADLTGAQWMKSTKSQSNGACVEVACNLPGLVGVRDSKDPQGPALAASPTAFVAFLGAVKHGRLDG